MVVNFSQPPRRTEQLTAFRLPKRSFENILSPEKFVFFERNARSINDIPALVLRKCLDLEQKSCFWTGTDYTVPDGE